MAIDISKLQSVVAFKTTADGFARALRAVAPAEGFERVIVPGEIEAKNEAQRKKEGIPIRDEVWQGVKDVATRLGIDLEIS